MLALHHVHQEIPDQLAVGLGLVLILNGIIAIDLGVARGIRSGLRGDVIPMLGNLALFIEAEDVEGDLFTHTGEVIDGLQEHLVAILEGPDVLNGGLSGSGGEVGHASNEGVRAGAVGEVVLNVAIRQQRLGLGGSSGREGIDKGERFFLVCHCCDLLNGFDLM